MFGNVNINISNTKQKVHSGAQYFNHETNS